MRPKPQFNSPADMFSRPSSRGWAKGSMTYRRFESLSSALEFAVEEAGYPLSTIVIRTDSVELTGDGIRTAYDEMN